VMATRTLENERERKLTILMNPFMSCGARLPVYALFVAAFFSNEWTKPSLRTLLDRYHRRRVNRLLNETYHTIRRE